MQFLLLGLSKKVFTDTQKRIKRITPSKIISTIYSLAKDINGSVIARHMKIAIGIQTIERRVSVKVSGPLLRLLQFLQKSLLTSLITFRQSLQTKALLYSYLQSETDQIKPLPLGQALAIRVELFNLVQMSQLQSQRLILFYRKKSSMFSLFFIFQISKIFTLRCQSFFFLSQMFKMRLPMASLQSFSIYLSQCLEASLARFCKSYNIGSFRQGSWLSLKFYQFISSNLVKIFYNYFSNNGFFFSLDCNLLCYIDSILSFSFTTTLILTNSNSTLCQPFSLFTAQWKYRILKSYKSIKQIDYQASSSSLHLSQALYFDEFILLFMVVLAISVPSAKGSYFCIQRSISLYS